MTTIREPTVYLLSRINTSINIELLRYQILRRRIMNMLKKQRPRETTSVNIQLINLNFELNKNSLSLSFFAISLFIVALVVVLWVFQSTNHISQKLPEFQPSTKAPVVSTQAKPVASKRTIKNQTSPRVPSPLNINIENNVALKDSTSQNQNIVTTQLGKD